MAKKTFIRWLEEQRDRNDATGDIARELANDPCLPADDKLELVLTHLRERHHAPALELAALAQAWATWVQTWAQNVGVVGSVCDQPPYHVERWSRRKEASYLT